MATFDSTTSPNLDLMDGQAQGATLVVPPRRAGRREKALDQRRLRRVWAVWALMFFNVLGSSTSPQVIALPHRVQQVCTQGALVLALVLALTLNPRIRLRTNLFLGLCSLLTVTTVMMSVRFVSLGTDYRSLRLLVFVVILWLLTPWWGRADVPLLRSHMRFLLLVLVTVLIGRVLAPGTADSGGRLGDAVWTVPPTQVAHYMAVLVGLTLLLWLCRLITRRQALLVSVPGIAVLLLTHTRTALIAMVVGVLVGAFSLFAGSQRVRRLFACVCVVVVFVALPFSPLIKSWLDRGESAQELSTLTGRTVAWTAVLSEQRPLPNQIFGVGMTNDSVDGASGAYAKDNGLPIDSGWVSTFQDQGYFGDVLEAVIFLALTVLALLRPRGPTRAMALFIIVYCFMASFTESGIGNASPYLLDLCVAASLLTGSTVVRLRTTTARGRQRLLPGV